jgi:protein-S-isoprenylcysteine O-methyltransferase Ste14
MDNGFLISAILFVMCLVLRSVYELLKEARKIDPENKLIFAAIFASMSILWISWFNLCPLDPLRMELPGPVRWFGFGIFLIGTVLAVGALIQLRGVENIDHLVTKGLFRRIRHPMYVGFIFWIIGWSLYHGAVLSLAIGTLGIASVLWWRHLEDTRLVAQFGDKYQGYRRTTWI